jgi:hypothetical protein
MYLMGKLAFARIVEFQWCHNQYGRFGLPESREGRNMSRPILSRLDNVGSTFRAVTECQFDHLTGMISLDDILTL